MRSSIIIQSSIIDTFGQYVCSFPQFRGCSYWANLLQNRDKRWYISWTAQYRILSIEILSFPSFILSDTHINLDLASSWGLYRAISIMLSWNHQFVQVGIVRDIAEAFEMNGEKAVLLHYTCSWRGDDVALYQCDGHVIAFEKKITSSVNECWSSIDNQSLVSSTTQNSISQLIGWTGSTYTLAKLQFSVTCAYSK